VRCPQRSHGKYEVLCSPTFNHTRRGRAHRSRAGFGRPALRTGIKFPIPFETLVVFSTNLDPRQLADEAFLRRIQNKVKVETISIEIFDSILRRVCENAKIKWTPEGSAYVREKCKLDGRKAVLRACYPRDIVEILKNIAEYEGRGPSLNPDDISRAVNLYFAR